jgi:ADP-ribosyl-[dinitrogen reductase] hydrolase
MKASQLELIDRYVGCLVGLACGDAIGTTVESKPRGSFEPVTDMIGGGPFDLLPGQWTDDTSMALCLAESLLYKNGFDPVDQMNRYVNWWQHGYLSSTGHCFDIGNATREALARYLETKDPFAGSQLPNTAGNGSLMRLAPIVLFYHSNETQVVHYSAASSRTTHAAPEAVECCQILSTILNRILLGHSKQKLLKDIALDINEPQSRALLELQFDKLTMSDVKGSGYCIESLKAALWCFFVTDSFSDAVLTAVNLGDDADTTGAIVGQLAGAYYGLGAIPVTWKQRLAMVELIADTATRLHQRAEKNR